jgi:tetratricopeptide (TPR) repeat protein
VKHCSPSSPLWRAELFLRSGMLPALRRLFLALLLFAGLPRLAGAATLEEANAFFNAGEFSKAAAGYESLIETSGPTASRLFNLGNARLRNGEHGPAILAYERAALLAPRDPDIFANLKLARKAATSHEELPTRSWWESVLHGLSLHEWSWLTLTSAGLMVLAVLAWGLAGFSRPWLKRSAVTALICGILAGLLGGFALWFRKGETKLGIITAAQPALRLSPFPDAAPAGSPRTGVKVILGDHSNGWVYVTVPGSNLSGWLPEKDAPPLMVP